LVALLDDGGLALVVDLDLPQGQRPVRRGGGEQGTAGGHGQRRDRTLVGVQSRRAALVARALQGQDLVLGGRVPGAYRAFVASRQEQLAVAADGHRGHGALVAGQRVARTLCLPPQEPVL